MEWARLILDPSLFTIQHLEVHTISTVPGLSPTVNTDVGIARTAYGGILRILAYQTSRMRLEDNKIFVEIRISQVVASQDMA
ncbi:hypothetical protein DTO212C5_8928 [Paecilomyces variotii]|nr:hypothetical protein DTO212C5_8928 [Paecilomyces variotii]